MVGIRISENEIASSSSCDFRMVSCPVRLSCMVSAMARDVPSQEEIAPCSFSISAGAAFMRARKPDMAFFPTSVLAAEACSDSESCEKATRQSARISVSSRILPSALVV